jgi:hypothetical protein
VSGRPEHTPAPGITWQARVITRELLVRDEEFEHDRDPRPNRATRRALKRAARKRH